MKASRLRNHWVDNSTYWPGKPQIIDNYIVDIAGRREAPGAKLFNCYIAPPPIGDVETTAERYIDHEP